MNILYIDHYAGSLSMGMEFRPYYLAREWQKMGHKVRIVGADFSHLRKVNPTVKNSFEIQSIDGVEFQWIKTREYEGNGISRAITMAQFCSSLWFHAGSIAKDFKPDVIVSSSTYPLDAFPGYRIKKKSRGLLVHEIHDMWPITPIELYGMSKWHPFVMVMQVGENFFCKHADKIVSVLPNAYEHLVKHGMKKEKFHFISNGIDLEDWDNPEPLPEKHLNVLKKAHDENRLCIVFFGSHTKSYSLDYLLKALQKSDQSKIFVAFVGEGNYKNELIELADRLEIDKSSYVFLPSINKKAIPSLLKNCDASYVGAMKNDMFRFGIGMNKLFDAMMGGKPILYAVEAPNNMIEDYQCGISIEAENTEDLILGIKKLIESDETERLKMGQNGRDAVIKHHTYISIAKKFIQVIN